MEFQFLCPNDHLLEGDETQVGRKCKCPYCSAEFLVPAPRESPTDAGSPEEASIGQVSESAVSETVQPPVETEPIGPEKFPGIRTGDPRKDAAIESFSPGHMAGQLGAAPVEQASVVHIPCPKGHILETPRDMIGQEAICPFCQTQFHLRLEHSEEYRQQQAERQQRRDQKLGQTWLYWSITCAVVVVIGLVVLVIASMVD